MSKKLRDWVRLDSKNIPVTGSNIRRPKKPVSGRWQEIEKVDCCGPTLTFDVDLDEPLEDFVFTLECDSDPILTVTFTGQDISILSELVSFLNANLGFLGVFSINEGILTFQVKSQVKDSLCPDDDLTFTVEADVD